MLATMETHTGPQEETHTFLTENTYDALGNQLADSRKGLQFCYNLANLPESVEGADGASLTYSYLSDGSKWCASANSGPSILYRGSFVYEDDGTSSRISSIAWGEGRISYDEEGDYCDEWFIRDHLGSVRAIVRMDDSGGTILEQNEYLPFGTRIPGSIQASDNRHRFGGKEEQRYGSDAATGTPAIDLGLLDFGARYYDPYTCRWTTRDPLAGKYLSWSPYNYCAGNPVNLVDIEGDKIFFVNGLKMFGSPEGGIKYWSSSFIKRSKEVLHDDNVSFMDINHRVLSSAKQRYLNGYKYVVDNLEALSKEIDNSETIKFVTHSMGAAFAEGMANAFEENGYKVNVLVHFSPYQAGDINTIGKDNNVLTIDFQTRGDLVISIASPGVVNDADYSIKRDPKASSIMYYHRESIDDSSSWDVLLGIIQEFLNTNK